jgi:FixJ family two-component response regulator
MSLGTPTVFVVDDDVSVRESLELLIESAGWQSQVFASAREFLAHSPRPAAPSCLVLDMSLPDLTPLGPQAVALARLGMPIILISGYDAGEVTARAREVGAVAFLRKPIDADALLGAIELAIAGSRGTCGGDGEV